jgi:hypothetical protein
VRKKTMPQTVAVDFDGVIHSYDKGWQDGTIYGYPIDGAFEGLMRLMEEYAVFIFTTRDAASVAEWIQLKSNIPCVVHVNPAMEFWNVQGELLVTNRKFPAVAYIDDRAIRFFNWTQTIKELAERQL